MLRIKEGAVYIQNHPLILLIVMMILHGTFPQERPDLVRVRARIIPAN
jgi:hypothetical protein